MVPALPVDAVLSRDRRVRGGRIGDVGERRAHTGDDRGRASRGRPRRADDGVMTPPVRADRDAVGIPGGVDRACRRRFDRRNRMGSDESPSPVRSPRPTHPAGRGSSGAT